MRGTRGWHRGTSGFGIFEHAVFVVPSNSALSCIVQRRAHNAILLVLAPPPLAKLLVPYLMPSSQRHPPRLSPPLQNRWFPSLRVGTPDAPKPSTLTGTGSQAHTCLWTSATRQALWVPLAGERMRRVVCTAVLTSSTQRSARRWGVPLVSLVCVF